MWAGSAETPPPSRYLPPSWDVQPGQYSTNLVLSFISPLHFTFFQVEAFLNFLSCCRTSCAKWWSGGFCKPVACNGGTCHRPASGCVAVSCFAPHPVLWLLAFARLDCPFLVQVSDTIKASTARPSLALSNPGGILVIYRNRYLPSGRRGQLFSPAWFTTGLLAAG